MITFKGNWYDGKTSASSSCVARVYDNGSLRVERVADGKLLSQTVWSAVTLSPPIADIPRYLHFPDGAKLETFDRTIFDHPLLKPDRPPFTTWIHHLESRYRFVTLCAVISIACLWLFIGYGVPALADLLSLHLPQGLLESAGQQTLKTLDKSLLSPSELAADSRERIQTVFHSTIAKHEKYRIKVIFRKGDKLGPNAFALPDGTIIFTDEMIGLSESDDALIGVLAHEIGHLVHRHAMRSIIQDSLLSFALMALTGDVSGTSELFLGIPALLTELAYSRKFETEADDYALQYMRDRNIETRHFAVLMRRIESEQRKPGSDNKGKWPGYLSTHPLMEKRLRKFDPGGTEASPMD